MVIGVLGVLGFLGFLGALVFLGFLVVLGVLGVLGNLFFLGFLGNLDVILPSSNPHRGLSRVPLRPRAVRQSRAIHSDPPNKPYVRSWQQAFA